MQVFDISIAPGTTRQVFVLASYVYFLNGSAGGADTTIGLKAETGSETVYLKPGQAYKFADGMLESRWILSNVQGAGTIIGQVMMGQGEFQDNRVSGTVEVVDGGKTKSLAGSAFLGRGANASSGGGAFPIVQLINPAASLKRQIVKQLYLGAITNVTPQSIAVMGTATALPVLLGNAPNKNQGQPASVAEIRMQNSGAPAGTGTLTYLNISVLPSTNTTIALTEPIILNPGFGLNVQGSLLTSAIDIGFEFSEESI